MASITLCPRCSSHLELPTGIAPTSLVECPVCEAEFLLASVAPRAIPKVRVIDREAKQSHDEADEESTASQLAPAPFSIVVDDKTDAHRSLDESEEKLSRLLRSTATWNFTGPSSLESADSDAESEIAAGEDEAESIAPAEYESIGDRIIPNDHAPSATTIGAAVDDAYRDADPELADRAPAEPDELQLVGSRLDQLLSDLMKPQSIDGARPLATADEPADEPSTSRPLADFEKRLAAEARAAAEDDGAAANVVEGEIGEDESFDSRWRRLQASDEPADVEYVADESDGVYVAEASPEMDFGSFDLRTTPPRKRRPAGVRTVVGIVGGGAIGILGGAYALLWLRGSEVDVLGMANWLPQAMLPPALQAPAQLAEQTDSAPTASDDGGEKGEDSTPLVSKTSSLAIADSPLEVEARPDNAMADVDSPSPAEPAAPIRHDFEVAPASAAAPLVADAPVASDAAAAPQAHWPTTPIVGQLQGAKLRTLDELNSLLVGADAAHRRFLAGNLAQKDDVAAMGQAYIELCKLAESFTLTDPSEFGNDLITKQIAAKNIFRGVAGDPARRSDLAMIAGRWLQHNRRPNQGVVLLGKVTDLQAHGEWTEYAVETPLGDATTTSKVLMPGVPFPSGSEIAVVGTIVSDPRHAIAGYSGDAPQVIVSAFAFVPEDYSAPKLGETGEDPADLFSLGK